MVTPRQKEVLAFIVKYVLEHDEAPSYREIGDALKITPNAVAAKLRALKIKGCLTAGEGRKRAIAITPQGKAAL